MLYVTILAFIGLPTALMFTFWIIRRVVLSRPRHVGEGRRCRCGYRLQHLEIPRCPECGRAIGFDATFAELGIDEADVRRHVAQRRADGSAPAAAGPATPPEPRSSRGL